MSHLPTPSFPFPTPFPSPSPSSSSFSTSSIPTPPPIRIAILDCVPKMYPKAYAKYGTWATIWERHLLDGADALGLARDRLRISKWDMVNGLGEGVGGMFPELDDVDAVLVTGSPRSVYENLPWITRMIEFIRYILLSQDRVRVIGSCFGHQVVAAALGAQVASSSSGWELSVCEMNLTEIGKELMDGKDHLSIFQSHIDNVLSLPSILPVQNLGFSPLCHLQGFYVPARLITMQSHPEMNEEVLREILDRRRGKLFEQEVYEDAMCRIKNKHDGVIAAKAFLRFCLT